MTRQKDIVRLQSLAGLILDHQLSMVHAAARAKAQSEAALAALAVQSDVEGLEGAAAALAGLAYERWADSRRAEINTQLARQTLQWIEAQSQAREAFGKAQVLRKLAESTPR